MAEKKYLNGIIIKEKVFDNGGKQLQVKVKVGEFIEELKSVEENDWANLLINRRKQASDKGVTHYMVVDTWKPDQKYQPREEDKEKYTIADNGENLVGKEADEYEDKNTEDRLPF